MKGNKQKGKNDFKKTKLHNKDTNNSIAGNRKWDVAAGYVPLISQNPYPIIVYSVAKYRARSIQPKFQPVPPGKEDHLKRWTRFFETFPVGPNRSIEFWTEISGHFG